jgi:uncharacterized FlaG/YvyC family protein
MSDPIAPFGSQGQVAKVVAGATPAPVFTVQARKDPPGTTSPRSELPQDPAADKAADNADKLELTSQALQKPKPAEERPPDLMKAAKEFQQYLDSLPSDLQFQPDDESGMVVFKVVHPITQKVLRRYPPEEVVEMAKALREARSKTPSGILLDHNL